LKRWVPNGVSWLSTDFIIAYTSGSSKRAIFQDVVFSSKKIQEPPDPINLPLATSSSEEL
jgi:hypothetical protein